MAPLGGLFATQRCHRVETEHNRNLSVPYCAPFGPEAGGTRPCGDSWQSSVKGAQDSGDDQREDDHRGRIAESDAVPVGVRVQERIWIPVGRGAVGEGVDDPQQWPVHIGILSVNGQ